MALRCFLGLLLGLILGLKPVQAWDIAHLVGQQNLLTAIEFINAEPADTLADVKQRPDWQPLTQSNLGYLAYPVWTRLALENSAGHRQSVVLKNPRAGMDHLEVSIVRHGQLAEHYFLGDLQPSAQHPVVHRYSVVPLMLDPGETLTVFTRLQNFGPLEATWMLQSLADFSEENTLDSLLWGGFAGMILTLIIYNLNLGLSLKTPFFFAYVVLALASLLFQFALNGWFRLIDHPLPLTWINLTTWWLPVFLFGALTAFACLFLQTRRTMPRLHRSLLYSFAGLSSLYLYQWLGGMQTNNWVMMIAVVQGLLLSLIVCAGIQGIRQGLPGATYYVLGQGSLGVAYMLQIFSLLNYLPIEKRMMTMIVPLATLVEIVFLSSTQSVYIKAIDQKRINYQLIALAQSRFSTIGKTMGHVIHQWKIPLARMGGLITELQASAYYQPPEDFSASAQRILPGLEQTLDMLEQTLSEFRSFYAADSLPQQFSPSEQINEVVDFFATKIMATSVQVEFSAEHEQLIVNYPHSFAHVVMILLDNALDVISERGIKAGRIGLHLSGIEPHLCLQVSDNAGGIALKPIDTVFNAFVSERVEASSGSGLGLTIARMIARERLGGDLQVSNSSSGACFSLTLALAQQ